MSNLIGKNFEKYEVKLEDIITKKVPLRDPSISVVHISSQFYKDGNLGFISMLKRLKLKHADWSYEIINAEKEVFEILKKLRYIEKQKFVLDCKREQLAKDFKNSIKSTLIKKIQEKISEIKERMKENSCPFFLIIQNLNSNYEYIQTKDIISGIINQKGLYVLIIYFQREKYQTFDNFAYKEANYNVDSYFLL